MVGTVLVDPSSLLDALVVAAAEGLEPNLARFLGFLGWTPGEVLELQALEVPRQRNPWVDGGSYVAHGSTLAELLPLLEQGQKLGGPGLYAILNQVTPAVADRYAPRGQWHRMADKQGTSDGEILARRAVYVDLDADRPKGLSAVDDHVARTFERAEALGEILARHVPPQALGWGHSGNGAALFVALNALPCDDETDRLVRAVLVACKHLASDPETFDAHRTRNEEQRLVSIDVSVSDRKRLCPAFGSLKAKGAAGLAHRPHRRTAFLSAEAPFRLGLDALRALVEGLRSEVPDEAARAEIDRARTDPKAKASPRPGATAATAPKERPWAPRTAAPGETFRLANDIPVLEVLGRLGLVEGDRPVCPGCRRTSKPGGMIEILQNGLKCSSGTCAGEGVPGRPGFRTVVDLVMVAQGLDAAGALGWLRAEFPEAGLADPTPPRAQDPAGADPRGSPSSATHPASTSAPDVPAQAASLVASSGPRLLTSDDFAGALAAAQRRLDGLEKPIPVPFDELAEQWGGGLWPGLHVLVSGTGAGKTTLALQLAQAAAEAQHPTLYIGLELEPLQIAARLLALEARVPWSDLYTARARRDADGNHEPPEVRRRRVQSYIDRATPHIPPLTERPFYVDFGSPMGWPASRLRTLAEQVRSQHPPERLMLVVLDFLQLVGDEVDARGRFQRTDLRERIGRAAYLARAVAKDLNAAVLVISSVSREKYPLVANAGSSETGLGVRLDRQGRPIARTLLNPEALMGLGKESGEVEFAADTVTAMLRWPGDLQEGQEQGLGRTGIVLASPKVRIGEVGWCELRFNGSRFAEPDDRTIAHLISMREAEKQAVAEEKATRTTSRRKNGPIQSSDHDNAPSGFDDC